MKPTTMRHLIISIGILAICFSQNQLLAQKKKAISKKDLNYKISFHLPNIPDSVLYIANYYGEHTYLRDTIRPLNNKNPYTFVFQGMDTIKRGVYILVSQDNSKYMEFLIDSSLFFNVIAENIDPKKPNLSNNLKFENSPENTIFHQYTNYAMSLQGSGASVNKKMREEMSKSTPDQELVESYRSQLKTVYDSMQSYTRRFIQENPTNLFAKAQKLTQDIEIPDEKPEGYPDTNWQHMYYYTHYWDNCDFTDNALVYTPVFHHRLTQYYDKVIHPSIDSLIKYSDVLIDKAKNSPELYKYIVWYLSNRFERSSYIGHDAIFVHLIRNYYQKGLCPWVDETVLEHMIGKADMLEPILIGKKAPWLIMPDVNGKFHTNYDFNHVEFTIMYFWDTDCGHCKQQTPKMLEFYNRAKDSLSFDIFAICLTSDSVKWRNYLLDKNLPWLNVGNNKANIDFREAYDIKASPRFYILNRDKKIIVKNIDFDHIEEFLTKYRKGEIKF